jgi:hypothetical protein
MAERLGESVIAIVDRRRFSAIRPRHPEAFEFLPRGASLAPRRMH